MTLLWGATFGPSSWWALFRPNTDKSDKGLWINSGPLESLRDDFWPHPCSNVTTLNCLKCFLGHLCNASLMYVLSFWLVQPAWLKSAGFVYPPNIFQTNLNTNIYCCCDSKRTGLFPVFAWISNHTECIKGHRGFSQSVCGQIFSFCGSRRMTFDSLRQPYRLFISPFQSVKM